MVQQQRKKLGSSSNQPTNNKPNPQDNQKIQNQQKENRKFKLN